MKNRVNTFLRNLSSSSSIFPHESDRNRFFDNKNIKEVNMKDENYLDKSEGCDKTEVNLNMRTFSVKNKHTILLN